MVEIFNADYNEYVDIIGTAHFTRRSINDAYHSITSSRPEDIALELDWRRFQQLNTACIGCPRRDACKGICEFTVASDTLGNVNANIWLIDMSEREMRTRIRGLMTPIERRNAAHRRYRYGGETPVWLWERGFKDRVINNSKRQIEAERRYFPSVWRVLIDERNALMAARLASIASEQLEAGDDPRILTFVGAAHVEGLRALLRNPIRVREALKRFNLSYSEPTLIRRVAVQAN